MRVVASVGETHAAFRRRAEQASSCRRVVLQRTGIALIVGFGWLWAGTAAAGTAEFAEMFSMEPPLTSAGLCFHEGMLYAVSHENKLVKYDPETGEQLEVVDPLIPNLPLYHLHEITHGAGNTFWVGEVMSQRLCQLRFSDYSVVSSISAPPGGPTYGLALQDNILWVAYHGGLIPTPVHAVDLQTEQVIETFEFGTIDVHGLEWVGGLPVGPG